MGREKCKTERDGEKNRETWRFRNRERLGDRETEGGGTSRAAEIERQTERERLGDIESERGETSRATERKANR